MKVEKKEQGSRLRETSMQYHVRLLPYQKPWVLISCMFFYETILGNCFSIAQKLFHNSFFCFFFFFFSNKLLVYTFYYRCCSIEVPTTCCLHESWGSRWWTHIKKEFSRNFQRRISERNHSIQIPSSTSSVWSYTSYANAT